MTFSLLCLNGYFEFKTYHKPTLLKVLSERTSSLGITRSVRSTESWPPQIYWIIGSQVISYTFDSSWSLTVIYSTRLVKSGQFSCSVVSDCVRPHGLQHARFPCLSPTPGAYSISCRSSQWCQPANSSFVVPFSSHLQSFPASGSFPMSQFFASWPKYWSFSFSISPSNDWSNQSSWNTAFIISLEF